MPYIYIVLTRSRTIISKIIGCFTKEPYTHASISFDDNIEKMYSFARKIPSLPLPAGLMEERIGFGFYEHQLDIPCALLRIEVSEEIYSRARETVDRMMRMRGKYHFNVLGMFLCGLNIAIEIPRFFFCSQFVASILEESGTLKVGKKHALVHPADFRKMDDRIECVYIGQLGGLLSCFDGPEVVQARV